MEQVLQTNNPYENWASDDEKQLSFFNPQNLGGKLSFLDEAALDNFANYFLLGTRVKLNEELNSSTTAELSARGGSFPDLVNNQKERLPGVVILQDAYAERWNTIGLDLAKGLIKSGVQVIYGEFEDSLRNVDLVGKHLPSYKEDGFRCAKRRYLSDLAQYKETHVLLIFSNGQGLIASRGVEAMRLMARWPRVRIVSDVEVETMSLISQWPKVAWLELREPRNWDEGAKLPLEYNIPLYPATVEALDEVLSQFFIKQQPLETYKPTLNHQVISSYEGRQIDEQGNIDSNFAGYVESYLGDSLSWARACAMFQPLSLGLADKLRRKFFADLSQQRLGRLGGLPNTSSTIWGLIFSNPVKNALREQFFKYADEGRKEAILKFILEEMENPGVKPSEKVDGKYTLSYLSWKAMYELLRVNISSERESAKKELRLLLGTPLGDFIRREIKFID